MGKLTCVNKYKQIKNKEAIKPKTKENTNRKAVVQSRKITRN
jgi:hypothetical protein